MMALPSRLRTVALPLLSGLFVLAAACQPATAPTPTPSAPRPTAPPAAAAPTQAPTTAPAGQQPAAAPSPVAKVEPRGQITIALSVDVTTLDPAMVSDQPTTGVLANLYEGLLMRKTGTMEPVPQLAESYRMVNETTWEFKLRRGVKFHNGEEFNAESVKFTLDRNIRPEQKAPQRSFIAIIKEVKIVDSYTVQIITDGPSPTLPNRLTTLTAQMLPPKYVQEKGDQYLATHPVGTGPYKFVSWTKDEQLVLEANTEYWGGAPQVKTLVFKPMPEASARIAAIQTGAVDIAANIPADQAATLKNNPNFSIQAVPSMLVVYMGIDAVTDTPTKKREVRQAINYAVDRETIVRDILRGYGKVSASAISEEVFGFDSSLKPYPFDPEKARQLLRDAAYPNGFSVTLHGPNGRYSMDRDVIQAIAGYLQNVGIKATVRTHEWGEYTTLKYGIGDPGSIYMLGWGGSGTFIPELALYPLVKSGETFSTTADPELDQLMERAMRTVDTNERANLWKQAQKRVYDEAYRLFLFQQYYIYGVSNRIQDWQPRADEFVIFKDITTNKDVTIK